MAILNSFKNSVKYWYFPFILGLLLVILGFYIFSAPFQTYEALAILFSISFIVSGILELSFAISNRRELSGWGWHLVAGILSLIIGLILISHPGLDALMLALYVGLSLLFRSVHGFGFAIELKNFGSRNWGLLAFTSGLGILFSILLILKPIIAGLSLVVMTALAFIFTGILSMVLSFQLKKLKDRMMD
ncbi:MAG: HdeD family acid-resistance protein [Flavobacteriaceae bacterium]|jgi:hypothetical protein|nr:HdeD family acid-resistance protein [Flavobacteriaceae bacterium]